MNCIYCEKEFTAKRVDSRLCSNSCRCRFYYRKNQGKLREQKLQNYYEKKEQDYDRLREINLRASRKYKQKNRELIKEKGREYQQRTGQSLRYHDIKNFGGNRQKIFSLYAHRCAMCKSDTSLVIHHVDGSGNSEKTNNNLDNLILLCRSCHAKIHYRGKLVDEDIVRTYVRA